MTYYVNNVNTTNTQVLMEYAADGTFKNSYTYGNERIRVETDYYLYDGRGSVSQLINADEIVEAYTYDPFGNVTDGAPEFESFYGYNAEETNPVTGLQYLRARYYDSETGRFCTADSYLGDITEPLTLNRYIYTVNNPVMYNDPSGHFVGTALLIAAAVAAVGITVGLTGCANTKEDIKNDLDVKLPTEETKENNVETPKNTHFENVRQYNTYTSIKLSKIERLNLAKNAVKKIEEKIDKVDDVNAQIPELPVLGESPYKYSKKYNTAKEFAEAYRDKIKPYAEQNNYDIDFLLSILFVESNGAGFNEEGLVRIRFENHVFFKYLPIEKVDEAKKYFNNTESEEHTIRLDDAEPVRLHDDKQYLEYKAFEIAKGIDENAAYMAISMGMGQVMGFNHKVLGYDTAKEMYEKFSMDADFHIEGVICYMNSISDLRNAIINKDEKK